MSDLRQTLVLFSLSLVLSVVINLVLHKKRVQPTLDEINAMLPAAERALKTGMSALGQKSADLKLEKRIEGMLYDSLIDQYPEIKMILEQLSPELLEEIEQNPRVLQGLMERWAPMIKQLTGINLIPEQNNEPKKEQPDYDF